MLGRIAGAMIGNRLASRGNGLGGALLGTTAARMISRGRLGPLGTALAVGYGAKKLYEWNRSRKMRATYPAEATPAMGSARTHGV